MWASIRVVVVFPFVPVIIAMGMRGPETRLSGTRTYLRIRLTGARRYQRSLLLNPFILLPGRYRTLYGWWQDISVAAFAAHLA